MLGIHPVVLELVRRLAPGLPLASGSEWSLGDPLERALISIPLNVSEGAYSRGKNPHARYQTAAGSAREALACLETAEALGWIGPVGPEPGALFQRVIGTLVRLVEPRPDGSPLSGLAGPADRARAQDGDRHGSAAWPIRRSHHCALPVFHLTAVGAGLLSPPAISRIEDATRHPMGPLALGRRTRTIRIRVMGCPMSLTIGGAMSLAI